MSAAWRQSRFGVYVCATAVILMLNHGSSMCAEPNQPSPRKPMPPSNETTASDDSFARALYARLAAGKGNVIVSPTSVEAAVLLALVGASGDTASQMASALHLSPEQASNPAPLLDRYATAKKGEDSSLPSGAVTIANSVWLQRGYAIHDAYRNLLTTHDRATFELVDFAARPEDARTAINRWVDRQTNHKIHELMPSGSVDTRSRLVLANAVYFKGHWKDPFKKRLTSTQPFHRPGQNDTTCSLMRVDADFRYLESETYQALELNYTESDLSMVVWLPKQAESMDQVEREICDAPLAKSLEGMARRLVHVSLPKFKIEVPLSLVETLKQLGVKDAFSDDADFSGISDERLKISAVVHRALVEVDEQGTEAAAATGITLAPTAAPFDPQEPKTFRADHPFVFAIRNRGTNQILFMGRVDSPTP
jgi:serpin B